MRTEAAPGASAPLFPELYAGVPPRAEPAFSKTDALGFLIAFARASRGRPFDAEEVVASALEAGLAPHDLRAWGAIFSIAAREGHIRRSEALFRPTTSNGALRPGWVSL